MTSSQNKCLIYGLILLFILNSIIISGSAKLIFCKDCRTTRNIRNNNIYVRVTTSPPEDTSVHVSHIINAPTKCKAGLVLDRRNMCRKLVFSN